MEKKKRPRSTKTAQTSVGARPESISNDCVEIPRQPSDSNDNGDNTGSIATRRHNLSRVVAEEEEQGEQDTRELSQRERETESDNNEKRSEGEEKRENQKSSFTHTHNRYEHKKNDREDNDERGIHS